MPEDKKLVLLVVDDEEGMRMGIRRSLRTFSMDPDDGEPEVVLDIREASSGEEAIAFMEKEPPDIVLLDNRWEGSRELMSSTG